MSGYRILMVDDNSADVEKMRAALQGLPEVSEFAAAHHAAEALEKLGERRDRFDVILMDQQWDRDKVPDDRLLTDLEGQLPAAGQSATRTVDERHRQGLGIMRFLRRHGVSQPIVFCTNVATWETGREAVDAGAYTYYPKGDLLAHPERVLYPLREGIADRVFLRRLCDRLQMDLDHLMAGALLARRSVWGRRWPDIVQATLEAAAHEGRFHLSLRDQPDWEKRTLPTVEAAFREELNAEDLRQLLARDGIEAEDIHHFAPFWLAVTTDGKLLAVLDPSYQHRQTSSPADWEGATTTWHQAAPAILPVSVKDLSLGPDDPYLGVSQLFLVEGTLPEGRWLSFSQLAGRLESPTAEFWQQLRQAVANIKAVETFVKRSVSSMPLILLNVATTGERCAVLPFPRNLVEPKALETMKQPLDHHLLTLHRGAAAPPDGSDADLERALAQLPVVEIWRGGVADEFEEETFRAVLDVLAEMAPPGNQPPRCAVWLGCDFANVRPTAPLTCWPRELDLVLLTPQGILLLECKASVLEQDLEKGKSQVIETRELLWGQPVNQRNRNPQPTGKGPKKSSLRAGVFLLPVLLDRLNQLPANDPVPKDVVSVCPPTLARQLRQSKDVAAAREIIVEYYGVLENIRVDFAKDLRPEEWTQRACVPAVTSLVVVPEKYVRDGKREKPLPVFARDVAEGLRNVLRQWLALPPIFDDSQWSIVHESLRHLCVSGRQDLREEYLGFQVERRDANLPGDADWHVLRGADTLTGAKQSWLVQKLRPNWDKNASTYGAWRTGALRDVVCEVRWLDARGQPATHKRRVRRLALVFHGQLEVAADLRNFAVPDLLAAVLAWWQMVCDESTALLLGAATGKPLPFAQRLEKLGPWRFGWLPGSSKIAKATKPANALTDDLCRREGRARAVEQLLELLQPHQQLAPVAPLVALLQPLPAKFRRTPQRTPNSGGDANIDLNTITHALRVAQAFAGLLGAGQTPPMRAGQQH